MSILEGDHTSDFDGEIFSHHTVSRCQISMDEFLGIQISHAISNLSSHLNHLLESWRGTARVILKAEPKLLLAIGIQTPSPFHLSHLLISVHKYSHAKLLPLHLAVKTSNSFSGLHVPSAP